MLLNLHGLQIATEIAGTGRPTVVFEAGAGMGKATWDPIWAEVAAFATVFRYDRPGLGESERWRPDAAAQTAMGVGNDSFADVAAALPPWGASAASASTPRTAGDVAEHLHSLLRLAGAPGPYLLVGHSFGGLVARFFAHLFPGDVAGAVLVDSSHPEQRSRSLAVLPPYAPDEAPALTSTRQRYMAPTDILPEGIDFGRSLAEAGRVPAISGVPLAVVSRSVPLDDTDLALLRPGLPPGVARDLELIWQELQRDLCPPGCRHLVAKRAGHAVHRDDSALVVQAIRAVLTSLAQPCTRPASSHLS